MDSMADKAAASASSALTSTTFDKNKQASSPAPRPSSSFSSSFSSSTFVPSSTSSSFQASASSIFASTRRRFSGSSTPFQSQAMDKADDGSSMPMAPPPPPPPPATASNKSNSASLMSPPDVVLDSFHQGYSAPSRSSGGNGRQASSQQPQHQHQPQPQQPLPMSPPISPCSKPITAASALLPTTPPGQIVQDPVLYPVDEQSPASPPAAPLFEPTDVEQHQKLVDEHVRFRSHSIFDRVAPPRREDYELALTFRSQVMKHYTANRKAWLRKERALLEADRRAGARRCCAIVPAKPIAAKLPKQRVDRVAKPHAAAHAAAHGPGPGHAHAHAGHRPIRTNNGTTNGTSALTRPAGRTSATPEPSRRVVAPNREDKNFNSIVDYCPPLDSLPDRANSLKVDWKGQPIDLGRDPFASLLHRDELLLAGNLRLDCATYLTSKRRIFERRLQCLRAGKEFRKTDAQQACKIDVNKASKLWTAFDKVGWLNPSWVRPYL